MKNKAHRGGNAHDRALARGNASETTNKTEVVSTIGVIKLSTTDRILSLIDSTAFQTLVGIVASLVGTFLDGRYFCVLGLSVSLALKKSKALDGLRKSLVCPLHMASVLLSGALLYLMGHYLNASRPHTYTPAEYANAVKRNLPLPIAQQITNIYNSYAPSDKKIGEPRVDLGEFVLDDVDPRGVMKFHISAVNNGTVPALDLRGSTGGRAELQSSAAENELFAFLESHANDPDQPHSDLPPGKQYEKIEPLTISPLSEEDRLAVRMNQKVIYLGRIDAYSDARGRKYESEACMFLQPGALRLMYCNGHNQARRIDGK